MCLLPVWIRRGRTTTWSNGETWPTTSVPGKEMTWISLTLQFTRATTGGTGRTWWRHVSPPLTKQNTCLTGTSNRCSCYTLITHIDISCLFTCLILTQWCFAVQQRLNNERGPRQTQEDEEQEPGGWRGVSSLTGHWCELTVALVPVSLSRINGFLHVCILHQFSLRDACFSLPTVWSFVHWYNHVLKENPIH